MDVLAHIFKTGACTSVEVHRDVGFKDLLIYLPPKGNEMVIGHNGSCGPRYYQHYNDSEWAIISNTDCSGNHARGRIIMKRWMKAQIS